MKRLCVSRGSLGAAIAVALLTGCAAGQGLVSQSAASQIPTGVRAGSPAGEFETLLSKHARIGECIKKGTLEKRTFKASGRATGPNPGSFTAHGTASAQGAHWSFIAKFEITSDGQTIPGTIHDSGDHFADPCIPNYGSDNMAFTMGTKTGRASAHIVTGTDNRFKAVFY
jgi:hypothetical protein